MMHAFTQQKENIDDTINKFGVSRRLYYSISFSGFHIPSLTGIHKEFDFIYGHFTGPHNATTHILGLLLIQGILSIKIDDGPIDKIMNKYVGTGDILSAQDELIDAGFTDQARL
jgi:hypothetical protein